MCVRVCVRARACAGKRGGRGGHLFFFFFVLFFLKTFSSSCFILFPLNPAVYCLILLQTGVELLREVIRGCYKYLGQENLLNCPDFPAEMKSLPSSPQVCTCMSVIFCSIQ